MLVLGLTTCLLAFPRLVYHFFLGFISVPVVGCPTGP